jgi:hypothetical protein
MSLRQNCKKIRAFPVAPFQHVALFIYLLELWTALV